MLPVVLLIYPSYSMFTNRNASVSELCLIHLLIFENEKHFQLNIIDRIACDGGNNVIFYFMAN